MRSLYQEVVKSPRDDLCQKLEVDSMPRDVFFDIYGVNVHLNHMGGVVDWFFDPIVSINDHIEDELWNYL